MTGRTPLKADKPGGETRENSRYRFSPKLPTGAPWERGAGAVLRAGRVKQGLCAGLGRARELVEEMDLRPNQAVPVGEMQALVFTVDVARGIVRSHQERGDATEGVGERSDERNRAADPHEHWLDTESRMQRAPSGVERRSRRVGLPRRRAFESIEAQLESPRHVAFDVRAHRVQELVGILAGTDPAAEPRARARHDLVRRALNGMTVEANNGHGR